MISNTPLKRRLDVLKILLSRRHSSASIRADIFAVNVDIFAHEFRKFTIFRWRAEPVRELYMSA